MDRFSPGPAGPRGGGVLFVGRLVPHKGVNDLVDAVPPDLPLELIGRPSMTTFSPSYRACRTGSRCVSRHDCTDADLVAAYRRSRCVVLPSVYKTLYGEETRVPELLGQTLLEGMACGIPAVCTDVASMPEVVVDGVTGFIVPAGRSLPTMRTALVTLGTDHARAEVNGHRRARPDAPALPVVRGR